MRQWHWCLCWPTENFLWLYFSKIIKLVLHLNWLTRFYIFLGSSGFKEEGRALKDVALDGVALPSIVARIALNGQNPPSFLYPALNWPVDQQWLTEWQVKLICSGKVDLKEASKIGMNRMYAWYDLREKYQVYVMNYDALVNTLHYIVWYEQEWNMTSCDLLGKPHFCDRRRVWWSRWPAAVFARGPPWAPLAPQTKGQRRILPLNQKVSWAPSSVRALITSKRCISFKVSLIRSNRNCLSPFHCQRWRWR